MLLDSSTICEDVDIFIKENKYPLLKKLNSIYLQNLSLDKRKVLISAINSKNVTHLKFLKEVVFKNLQIFNNNNTLLNNFVSVFIDFDDDKKLFEFFKLNDLSSPQVILFDFASYSYFLDPQSYNNEENQQKSFINLLNKIKNNEIELNYGNFLDNFFNSLGLTLSPTILSISLIGFVFVFICLVIVVIFLCDGKATNVKYITLSNIHYKIENVEKVKNTEEDKKEDNKIKKDN